MCQTKAQAKTPVLHGKDERNSCEFVSVEGLINTFKSDTNQQAVGDNRDQP